MIGSLFSTICAKHSIEAVDKKYPYAGKRILHNATFAT
jgi:hypothetical protein